MTATEESWTSWLCDWGQEDCYNFKDSDAKWVDDMVPPPQEENVQISFSTNIQGSCSSTVSNSSENDKTFGEPLKIGTSNSATTSQRKDSSVSYILSFNNVNPAPTPNIDSNLKPKPKGKDVVFRGRKGSVEPRHNVEENKNSGSVSRSPHHAKDHIIAERKRREKINQQFIALSALIPGLKKMDKASVLEDAIKHVKQLQEQVKILEEQNKRKRVESVVYVEKSKFSSDEDIVSDTSSNSSYDPSKTNGSVPEVEAMVSEKNVLIRIHCEKQKGVFMNILKEVEDLHLSVTNSSILLFGTSNVDITIVAEMGDEFSLSVKEVARNLKVRLMQFM